MPPRGPAARARRSGPGSLGGTSAAAPMGMPWPARLAVTALCIVLPGCTLSRPQYAAPDVQVGESAFVRAMEAHTMSGLVAGNRAEVLLNGEQIFPAMLAAIRSARTTITFANFVYEDGEIASEMAGPLAPDRRARGGADRPLPAGGLRGELARRHRYAAGRRRVLPGARAARRPGHSVREELAGQRRRRGLSVVPAGHRRRPDVDQA